MFYRIWTALFERGRLDPNSDPSATSIPSKASRAYFTRPLGFDWSTNLRIMLFMVLMGMGNGLANCYYHDWQPQDAGNGLIGWASIPAIIIFLLGSVKLRRKSVPMVYILLPSILAGGIALVALFVDPPNHQAMLQDTGHASQTPFDIWEYLFAVTVICQSLFLVREAYLQTRSSIAYTPNQEGGAD